MRQPELDERLKTIADLVRPGSRVADIGCDHAYLICHLADSGVIPGGIACDLNEGPLSQAGHEIERRRLSDRIECRLGNGLSIVGEDEVDDIIIAGMGGELIAEILGNCSWSNKAQKRFLLQPMSRAPFLRRWLYQNGYIIEKETACFSSGRPYTVMQVGYDGVSVEIGEYDLSIYVGRLTEERSAAAKEYVRRAAVALLRQENGLIGRDSQGAERLRSLSNKLLSVIEGW